MKATDNEIIDAMYQQGVSTTRSIASEVGMSKPGVERRLRGLLLDDAICVTAHEGGNIWYPRPVGEVVDRMGDAPPARKERGVWREQESMLDVLESCRGLGAEFTVAEVRDNSPDGWSYQTVWRHLKELRADGFVSMEGNAKATVWAKDGLGAVLETVELKDKTWRQEWDETREDVLERDGSSCVECGGSEDVLVHHTIPHVIQAQKSREIPKETLRTLCRGCHGSGGGWGFR